jgi:glutamate racemase
MPSGARIDTLLLGCTHYPLLGRVIREVVGKGTAVIDSATATASALASLLEIHGLGAPGPAAGRHRMLTTGDVTSFRETAARLFGSSLGAIEAVRLDGVSTAAPAAVTSAAGIGA